MEKYPEEHLPVEAAVEATGQVVHRKAQFSYLSGCFLLFIYFLCTEFCEFKFEK